MKELILKTTLFCISIFFSFHLVEFGLKKFDETKEFSKPQFDDTNIIQKKKAQGAVSVIPGTIYLNKKIPNLLPLGGISLKETIFGNENDYLVTYNSDRYGFRNEDYIWEKPIDSILIGDSFGHGAHVKNEFSISGVLNKNSIVTLNLGYGGTGPLSQYAILKEYFPSQKKIKNVIWCFYEGNDMFDLVNELKDEVLVRYLEEQEFSQNLKEQQNIIDEMHYNTLKKNLESLKLEIPKKLSERIKYFFSFKRIKNLTYVTYHSIFPAEKEFERVLVLIKDFTTKNDAKLYFVYLPEFYRFTNLDKFYDLKYKSNYKKITNIAKKHDVKIIDIANFFESEVIDPFSLFPYRSFGHYNEKGYQLVGKEIIKKIAH